MAETFMESAIEEDHTKGDSKGLWATAMAIAVVVVAAMVVVLAEGSDDRNSNSGGSGDGCCTTGQTGRKRSLWDSDAGTHIPKMVQFRCQ